MKYTPEQITELLKEVNKLLAETTPGPWAWRKKKWEKGDGEWEDVEFSVGELRQKVDPGQSYNSILDVQKNKYGQPDIYAWIEADAHLIANSPTWLQQLTEIVQQQTQQLSVAWKAYDNLKAEMEALGDQSSVLKESLSAVVDELKSTKIKLEEEQRVALHHERERCRVSTKLAMAVETLKEISQGERSSIALAHMAADALVRIKASQETE
ncbi:hypothetical protein [Paenibacillus elgii]|uniref:hypothetical protein n=1 Tax=Paenibacillus elgii TaxID=189691 RepID=UPI00203FD31C|nr:hypothetical protein [Paenibacillus elgii]MCM3272575.1 hypothetical protein [Paenibacillus elgii]